jgi:allophanate hydrolase subunit 1
MTSLLDVLHALHGELQVNEQPVLTIEVECYAGHRGEQTPRALIVKGTRIAVTEVLDAWLAPDYRYFKLKGADGHTYLVRHDERAATWELTMFRARRTT